MNPESPTDGLDPPQLMQFKPGDRVLMVKHSDWKNEAAGTITVVCEPRRMGDGTMDDIYWIDFDEPQRDYTDEMHGRDMTYFASNVAGRFLRSLG